jgi:hypothetical protein
MTELAMAVSQELSAMAGVNVLLEGPTGTGKTHALATLAETGVELFILFAENGLETFLGYWTDKGQPIPPNVHYHVLDRSMGSFKILADMAFKINNTSMEALFKMSDPDRHKSNQYWTLLNALTDFPDDRTGKKFGAIDSWGPDRAFAIDSLSALNPWAMGLVVGNKPLKDQRDWGVAQDLIEKLLRQLTDGCKCHFILLSHVERETDQVYGGVKLTVSTLGRALAPKIPPMFSDVVLTVREGKNFSWSTANPQADLKTRNLPIADNIAPTFVQIIDRWKSRGGRLTAGVKK